MGTAQARLDVSPQSGQLGISITSVQRDHTPSVLQHGLGVLGGLCYRTGLVAGKTWGKVSTLSPTAGNTKGNDTSNSPRPFPCPRCSREVCPC